MTRPLALLTALALLAGCAAPPIVPAATETPLPAPPTATATAAPASISGVVWHDVCANQAAPTPLPGCNTDFEGDSVHDPSESGIAGLTVSLGLGPCPSIGLVNTSVTDAEGRFIFDGLSAGAYCVLIDPHDTRNADLLLPGQWTLPRHVQVAAATVTVNAGEARPGVDFGWDFELQPAVAPPTVTPAPLPTQAACADRAEFVTDLSIPDNTPLAPGAVFVKTWQIRNTGECDWRPDYALVFVSGAKMNGPDAAPLPGLIPPGATVNVSVTLTAPAADGVYRGEWQLRSPGGKIFGGGSKGTEKFWVQIVVGSAATPTSAPQPGAFELGGQVSDFRAPDQMRYAGMAWVKRQVRWSPGKTASADAVTDAHAKGFKILLSVIGTSPDVILGNFDGYAAFVGDLARLGADGIEVWNEMNLDREWPAGQINPASYTDLLRRSYQQIKAQNPGTLVISGAPSPTGAEGAFGLDHVWNDDRYLAGMASAGAASYADCIGVHYNEGVVGPTQSSGDPRNPSDYYSRYYPAMVKLYSDTFLGARKLCFTELGYLTPEGYGPLPASFAWGGNTTVAQQAQWLGEAAALARDGGKVRLLMVFNVDFTVYGDDPQAGFAILRPGGGCPACDALHAVTGGR
jgi:hypothetical protein